MIYFLTYLTSVVMVPSPSISNSIKGQLLYILFPATLQTSMYDDTLLLSSWFLFTERHVLLKLQPSNAMVQLNICTVQKTKNIYLCIRGNKCAYFGRGAHTIPNGTVSAILCSCILICTYLATLRISTQYGNVMYLRIL